MRLTRRLCLIARCAALALACLLAPAPSPAAEPAAPPILYYDLTPLFALKLDDPVQLRRFWDEMHLVSALQGLMNRSAARLYVRCVKDPDDFWWSEMTRAKGWMAGRRVERIDGLDRLLARCRTAFRGLVAWDERTPATANLAATIAGCDDLLCIRYDPAPGALYGRLTGPMGIPVRQRLMRPDGAPLFTGFGTIPGTRLASTGSAKCDAYRWLIERYVKTGRANPRCMGYYLDGDWLRSWRAGAPENCTLTNQDFVIARRGVMFDLDVWDDETPVDDPGQRPGADADTLRALLRAAWDRFAGRGVIHVAGFVPWGYKYTDYSCPTWSAGGKHGGVATEWKYAEILSCFNAYMDADALAISAMANASFFQHFPLAPRYAQNPRPNRAGLIAAGILDARGRIVPRHYVAHYVGDYDSAAWLYRWLPKIWRDPARGKTPLSWAFNPNLAERFAFGMAWARQRRTARDWFVAGDSGAGYLNPGLLTPPRSHSGLPSGMAEWARHCARLYRQWDLTLTGFLIDGNGPAMAKEGWDAYARFSPDGIVAQKAPTQGVRSGIPFTRIRSDFYGDPDDVAKAIVGLNQAASPTFRVYRSILQTPTWYAAVEAGIRRRAGDGIRVVDLYTLLWLVREAERVKATGAPGAWSRAVRVSVTPAASDGLWPVAVDDGPFEIAERDGSACWRAPANRPVHYLYFDVAEGFQRSGGGAVEVEVEYLDAGRGRIVLEYDSSDRRAPVEGAYKPAAFIPQRAGAGGWRTLTFRLPDPRFAGMQNGDADLRLCNDGDDLYIRRIALRRAP